MSTALSGPAFVTSFGRNVVVPKQMWIFGLWFLLLMLTLYIEATRIGDYRYRRDDVHVSLFFEFMFPWVLWNRLSRRIFAKDSETQEVEWGA